MDFAAVSALLSSIKTATDIAKFFKDSDVSLATAETKLKLADLISALADVKLEAAEIQQTLLERDEKIRQLEREAKIRLSVKWRQPCYWLENSEAKEEPYCQHCYDGSQKLVRLHSDDAGRYQCRVCDNTFVTNDRQQQEAAALKRSRGNVTPRLA